MQVKEVYLGAHKIVEESSELNAVIAKLNAFPDGKYPDGTDLNQRLIEEMTDLLAALAYLQEVNDICVDSKRYRDKLDKFYAWGLSGIPVIPTVK